MRARSDADIVGGVSTLRVYSGRRFSFGECELDESRIRLRPGGVVVSLQSQPLRLLLYLLENPRPRGLEGRHAASAPREGSARAWRRREHPVLGPWRARAGTLIAARRVRLSDVATECTPSAPAL